VPNDRNSSSILSNNKLANYSTLAKYLNASSNLGVDPQKTKSGKPDLGKSAIPAASANSVDSNNDPEMESLEVLESLLSQNIATEAQAQTQDNSANAVSGAANRAKEVVDNAAMEQVAEAAKQAESTEQTVEAAAEASPENPEAAELAGEIKEMGKESREQREAAEIKEKQAAINKLVQEAANNPPIAIAEDNPEVVVLPITEKEEKSVRFSSSKNSLTWLVEWAKKIRKLFAGAVVYKEELDQSEDV
jgi:hypothetical protein